MFRTIPGAQLCVVPNASHGVLSNETILTFLRHPATNPRPHRVDQQLDQLEAALLDAVLPPNGPKALSG